MEYNNIYVALLDILGFKALIENNSLIEDYKKIFEEFIEVVDSSTQFTKAATMKLFRAVNFNLYSDTIILWTDDDSIISFVSLNLAVSNLLNYSMQIGLPLRGAISSGNLLCNPFKIESDKFNFINTILGTSLINAYQLEKDQLWAGCIIDPELEMSSNEELNRYLKAQWMGKFYVRYDVPLKNIGCRSMLTINWVNLENDVFTEEKIKGSFAAHNKKSNRTDVAIKIENTLKYYKHVKNLRSIT